MRCSSLAAAILIASGVCRAAPALALSVPMEPVCAQQAPVPPSAAERALARGRFAEADRLFAAMPPSDEAVEGQVRAAIGERQWNAALALAQRATADHPHSAVAITALGEARLARGEPVEAQAALRQAVGIDPCLARAHYALSRYLELSGIRAGAQRELDLAYKLRPTDPVIARAWKATQEPVPTPDNEIADMRAIEARSETSAERKAQIESLIKAFEAEKRGNCELVSPSATGRIPLVPRFADGRGRPPTGAEVELVLDGKKRQLLLDTGATGITLSREAAAGLDLTPEADVTSSGIGDDGQSNEFLAHVRSLRIGDLEFRNCQVRVQTRPHGLDTAGLFGPDTLRSLLLTFDFPRHELRTAALPPLPADGAAPQSIAASRRDRFVPPELASWTPAYKEDGTLLVGVSIGASAAQNLFILDTGMQDGLIAIDVARAVTTVTARPDVSMRGSSGVTHDVSDAGPIAVALPGFSGRVSGMSALADLSNFTPRGDARVSGFIGYDVLRGLVLGIDYRDALETIITDAPTR